MNWYLQIFGGLLGFLVCLYGYVCGDLILIGKNPFLDLNIVGFICGYTLYPLCFLVVLLPLISKAFRINIEFINKKITHLTVIIGLLGCKYFFIIPGIFILFNYYMPVLFEKDLKKKETEKKAIELLNNNLGKQSIMKILDISCEDIEKLDKNIKRSFN